eukprot:GHVL01014595.1.p1 GENE.GHVL01014595.1~~GHVL01014595.1.p1  ORF type:complete len:198 (+),score=43.48 GHVL01014595.1:96-689(+)
MKLEVLSIVIALCLCLVESTSSLRQNFINRHSRNLSSNEASEREVLTSNENANLELLLWLMGAEIVDSDEGVEKSTQNENDTTMFLDESIKKLSEDEQNAFYEEILNSLLSSPLELMIEGDDDGDDYILTFEGCSASELGLNDKKTAAPKSLFQRIKEHEKSKAPVTPANESTPSVDEVRELLTKLLGSSEAVDRLS